MKIYFLNVLRFLGLAPSKDEENMVAKIKNSYSSLKVSNRGVVSHPALSDEA